MTEAELVRLLDVARRRPLLEALTVRRGERKGEAHANVRPEVRERLDALGRERALIYKTLVLTGLRKNELASLTVAQVRLDGPVAHVELDAADEKSRKGNGVVVRADLAEDLKLWLADKLAALQADARRRFGPIPAEIPPGTPVFDVPAGLVRMFDRDLNARRHPEARQAGPHARRTRPADDLRHAPEPGRGALAGGPSRDEAFRPESHGQRLHRPPAARRERGARHLADPSARRGPSPFSGACPSDRDRRRRPVLRCTACCTDSLQRNAIGGNP